jgi:hypothetical protein
MLRFVAEMPYRTVDVAVAEGVAHEIAIPCAFPIAFMPAYAMWICSGRGVAATNAAAASMHSAIISQAYFLHSPAMLPQGEALSSVSFANMIGICQCGGALCARTACAVQVKVSDCVCVSCVPACACMVCLCGSLPTFHVCLCLRACARVCVSARRLSMRVQSPSSSLIDALF